MNRRRRPRRAVPAAARGALLLALAATAPGAARGNSLIDRLVGETPLPDSVAVIPLDTLGVRDRADMGWVTPPELLDRAVGFDNGRTGVEGVFRPLDPGTVGRSRTALTFDGLPAGPRVVHWDNLSWIPLRALNAIEIARPGEPGSPEAAGAGGLGFTTFRAGDRPTSTVAITGGSYGHRLAELDFERKFGATGFHADIANLNHDGFGAFSDVEDTRGFVRLDFPLAGWGLSVDGVLESGSLSYLESFVPAGTEETDERRLSVTGRRPGGAHAWSLLRHVSRLEAKSVATGPFALTSGLTRVAVDRDRGRWTWGFAAARETRSGVLPEDADFLSAEGRLGLSGARLGPVRARADVRAGWRDPTGTFLDPSAEVSRGFGRDGVVALSAGRASAIPGILFHEEMSIPDLEALQRILSGIESLDRPESYWSAGLRAEKGTRFRAGLYAGVTRASDRLLLTLPSPVPRPFRVADTEWTGQIDAAVAWRPSSTVALEAWGGWHEFDRETNPFGARLRGEARLTLRRLYFERDLDLSATGFVRVTGSRVNTFDEVYPTLVTGGVVLTGRIRTLTLFWRVENAGRIVVESDFLNGDLPVYLPGLHNRIGATLHLVD